ncbi:cell division protein DivIVA [Embleya hyalina]|uniref:Cell wall synthesis protein Wag31 n=1 Tax=Embleya hyalina TaxID=516124 RepID=A0A401Z3A2_9ACTN|nr:cell division protein DivIVA [Embleya hyalina]
MEWSFTRTRLREGYAIAEVDAFLALVRDSLDGTAAVPMTAARVREQQFTTVRLREGYDENEVDAALDEIEAGLAARAGTWGWSAGAVVATDTPAAGEPGADSADTHVGVNRFAEARAEAEVKAVALRPAGERFDSVRRGYGRDEVDALVGRVDAALRGRLRQAPEQVLADRFEIVRRGYDRTQVDAWRDRAADLLIRRGLDDSATG